MSGAAFKFSDTSHGKIEMLKPLSHDGPVPTRLQPLLRILKLLQIG